MVITIDKVADWFIRNWFFLTLGLFAYVYVLLFSFLREQKGRGLEEPPELKPSVPYIGHLVGSLYHGFQYVDHLWWEAS